MRIRKWIISIVISIIFIIILFLSINVTANNDHVYYGPAPPPIVYTKYTISMNLTDSRPTVAFLQLIKGMYPLLYNEDALVTNTTTVWVGTANQEFTLYISNATPTSINEPIILNATATANSTGGITWILEVPLQYVLPQAPVYAQWYIVITENTGGFKYVVFLFRTGYENLAQVLSELSTVGGYLIAMNGEPYYLWHHYYGYNPTTGTVSTYYEVGLPGINIFYTWVGQGANASSWPEQGFSEVLKSFEFGFSEYVNGTLVEQIELLSNETIGQLTNYGYSIYGRPRLVPFGPAIYTSPIILLSNGTIVNPVCLSNTYFPLTISEILASGELFPVYLYNATPTELYVLNNSLIFGGYALAYDFFNETALPLTTEQYLTPPYSSTVTQFTECTLQLYAYNYDHYNSTNSVDNTNTVNTTINNITNNETVNSGNTSINTVSNGKYYSDPFISIIKYDTLKLVYALSR